MSVLNMVTFGRRTSADLTLHGQAVGTCMGFGAYLAYKVGFINEAEMVRILKVISDCELSLYGQRGNLRLR